MSESRSEFEAWFREGNGGAAKWLAPNARHGEQYNDLTTDAMWDAWQASRRAALEEAIGTLDEFEPSMSDDGVCYYLRQIEMAIRSLA